MTQAELKQAYAKERRRLKQFVRRAEKRGYWFIDDVIPSKPKKITEASVRRLQRLTPEKLYKKAEWVDIETGEVISPKKHQKEVRKQAVQKAKATRQAKKTPLIKTPTTGNEDKTPRPQEMKNPPSTPPSEAPSRSIIDRIVLEIESIPDTIYYKKGKVDMIGKKNALQMILESRLTEAQNNEEDYEYLVKQAQAGDENAKRALESGDYDDFFIEDLEREYLENEDAIFRDLDNIAFDSDDVKANDSYISVATILAGGMGMSDYMRAQVSDMTDYVNGY